MKMQNVKQMDSEYNDIVISPDIAGTDKYVCVGQSFDELLIDRHRVDYVFRFTVFLFFLFK
jgi:hypothetical protein